MTNGPSHPYHLDESTYIQGTSKLKIFISISFSMNFILKANSLSRTLKYFIILDNNNLCLFVFVLFCFFSRKRIYHLYLYLKMWHIFYRKHDSLLNSWIKHVRPHSMRIIQRQKCPPRKFPFRTMKPKYKQ